MGTAAKGFQNLACGQCNVSSVFVKEKMADSDA